MGPAGAARGASLSLVSFGVCVCVCVWSRCVCVSVCVCLCVYVCVGGRECRHLARPSLKHSDGFIILCLLGDEKVSAHENLSTYNYLAAAYISHVLSH